MCGQELLQRRAVHSVADMPLHRFDARTFAHQLPPLPPGLIDPFLGVDAFDMPHHFFLPHPHGGMSAVTLMLEDSPGGVINRDSHGDHSTIAPGCYAGLNAPMGNTRDDIVAYMHAFQSGAMGELPASFTR